MGWDIMQTSHHGRKGSPYREGGAIGALHICSGRNLEQDKGQGAFGRPNIGIFSKSFVDSVSEGIRYRNGEN